MRYDQPFDLFHGIPSVNQLHIFLEFHAQDQPYQRGIHRISGVPPGVSVEHGLIARIEHLVDQALAKSFVLCPRGALEQEAELVPVPDGIGDGGQLVVNPRREVGELLGDHGLVQPEKAVDHGLHQSVEQLLLAGKMAVKRPGRQARLFADGAQRRFFEPVRKKLFPSAFEERSPNIEGKPRHIRLRQNKLAIAYQ